MDRLLAYTGAAQHDIAIYNVHCIAVHITLLRKQTAQTLHCLAQTWSDYSLVIGVPEV